MSRFDVYIDRDVIVDNLTKKEYEIPYDEVNFALWNIICDLSDENEQLKERLYEFEKRKIIEESEIDEDVIPKIKLLRTELFGEKYE